MELPSLLLNLISLGSSITVALLLEIWFGPARAILARAWAQVRGKIRGELGLWAAVTAFFVAITALSFYVTIPPPTLIWWRFETLSTEWQIFVLGLVGTLLGFVGRTLWKVWRKKTKDQLPLWPRRFVVLLSIYAAMLSLVLGYWEGNGAAAIQLPPGAAKYECKLFIGIGSTQITEGKRECFFTGLIRPLGHLVEIMQVDENGLSNTYLGSVNIRGDASVTFVPTSPTAWIDSREVSRASEKGPPFAFHVQVMNNETVTKDVYVRCFADANKEPAYDFTYDTPSFPVRPGSKAELTCLYNLPDYLKGTSLHIGFEARTVYGVDVATDAHWTESTIFSPRT